MGFSPINVRWAAIFRFRRVPRRLAVRGRHAVPALSPRARGERGIAGLRGSDQDRVQGAATEIGVEW